MRTIGAIAANALRRWLYRTGTNSNVPHVRMGCIWLTIVTERLVHRMRLDDANQPHAATACAVAKVGASYAKRTARHGSLLDAMDMAVVRQCVLFVAELEAR